MKFEPLFFRMDSAVIHLLFEKDNEITHLLLREDLTNNWLSNLESHDKIKIISQFDSSLIPIFAKNGYALFEIKKSSNDL